MPTLDDELLALQKALEKKSAAVGFKNSSLISMLAWKHGIYAVCSAQSRVLPVRHS